MTAATIIRDAQTDGVSLALSETGNIKAIGSTDAVGRWIDTLKKHKIELIDVLRNAANDDCDTQDWRTFASQYYAHHFGCEPCIAAGKGYGRRCEIGLPLWEAYTLSQKSTVS